MNFEILSKKQEIYLYAGDLKQWNCVPVEKRFQLTNKKWVGLTLPEYGANGKGTKDENHIHFDILDKMPLKENSVDIYQSEDVHEHIDFDFLENQINEIYRVLKPDGLFRLSVPDYNCDLLFNRTTKDENGQLMFDEGGGGWYDYNKKKIMGNGHVWFPTYEKVKNLLDKTKFKNINFLQYWTSRTNFVLNNIDYKKGYITRTPDNDRRVMYPVRRPMSIVVDCYK